MCTLDRAVVRVFSISKGGVDREDEVRFRAQPLWNGNSIISSIWAILTRHINLGGKLLQERDGESV